jgi:hypothetical protein
MARLAVNVTVSPAEIAAQLPEDPTAHVSKTEGAGSTVTFAAADVTAPAVAVMSVSAFVFSVTLASPAASVVALPLLSVPCVAEKVTGMFDSRRPVSLATVATTCTVPPFWETVAGFTRTVTVLMAAAPIVI